MRRGGSAVGLILVAAGVLILFLTHSSLGSVVKGGKAKGVTAAIAVGSSSETSWIDSLLVKLDDPQSSADVDSIADWISKETVGWPPQDQGGVVVNNPLNTTQPEPGSRDYNSGGVQVYPSLAVGLQGTYDTLVNGRYGDILSRLRSGQGLRSGASAGLSTWSHGSYTSV